MSPCVLHAASPPAWSRGFGAVRRRGARILSPCRLLGLTLRPFSQRRSCRVRPFPFSIPTDPSALPRGEPPPSIRGGGGGCAGQTRYCRVYLLRLQMASFPYDCTGQCRLTCIPASHRSVVRDARLDACSAAPMAAPASSPRLGGGGRRRAAVPFCAPTCAPSSTTTSVVSISPPCYADIFSSAALHRRPAPPRSAGTLSWCGSALLAALLRRRLVVKLWSCAAVEL